MRILHIIAAFFMLVATPAFASETGTRWVVTQKSGDVRVLRKGLQPASVQLRSALAPGDVISTGANGRAMLTKGEDYVIVAPTSRLVLPAEEQKSGFTRLIQQVGTMLYKVKRTGTPHFAVETPMLAAVVKGTTFTVVVDQNRAAVQVTEGLVEVSSLNGEARRLVEGGKTVYISRDRPNEIIDVRSSVLFPEGVEGAVKIEASRSVPLKDISTLTNGLVREAPAPVVATAPVTNLATPALNVGGAPTTGVVGVVTGGVAPVTGVVQTVVPAVGAPVGEVVGTITNVTAPVTGVVQTVVTPITAPVVNIVETVVTPVTAPVVNIVETVVPPVTAPVVEIVETVVPPVTAPVVEIVETVVPPVTEPVVEIVETVVPPVTEPVVEVVETVVPPVTEPVVEVVETVSSLTCGLTCPK